MKETPVRTFADFHACIEQYGQKYTVFRGVSDVAHELIPKIGRPGTKVKGKMHKVEADMLSMFQDRSVPYLTFTPRNDWEWVALMQHHGAPTRLLDWSRNPLVAAYFAVEKDSPSDGAVYVWSNKERPVNIKKEVGPFAVEAVRKFIPAHVSERIIAQAGMFTVHPAPFLPMAEEGLEKIVLAQGFKKQMKDTLFKYGVHRATLFPGLDGLVDHLTWLHVEGH